jgi:hypothetical protein
LFFSQSLFSVNYQGDEFGMPQPVPVDRRAKFATMKSMSTESRVSTESSGSQQQQLNFRPCGGSYSSKTGASNAMLISAMDKNSAAPKLALVARALMAAKAAGELPQASKADLELQETYR